MKYETALNSSSNCRWQKPWTVKKTEWKKKHKYEKQYNMEWNRLQMNLCNESEISLGAVSKCWRDEAQQRSQIERLKLHLILIVSTVVSKSISELLWTGTSKDDSGIVCSWQCGYYYFVSPSLTVQYCRVVLIVAAAAPRF